MSENTIAFTVYGTPQSAGSKRAFMRPGFKHPSVVDANPKSKSWQNEVRAEAVKHFAGELLTGPLYLGLVFYRPRPAGHFKKGGELSAYGKRQSHPMTRPDALKLARGVEDALTKVVYRDDAQIVQENLIKRWGEPARCEITICQLEE